MSYENFPESAQVTVGDVIRTSPEIDNLTVVFDTHGPTGKVSLGVSELLRDEEGGFKELSAPGTYSGYVEVIGRISPEQLIEGWAKHWPKEMAEYIRESYGKHVQNELDAGPVIVINNLPTSEDQ